MDRIADVLNRSDLEKACIDIDKKLVDVIHCHGPIAAEISNTFREIRRLKPAKKRTIAKGAAEGLIPVMTEGDFLFAKSLYHLRNMSNLSSLLKGVSLSSKLSLGAAAAGGIFSYFMNRNEYERQLAAIEDEAAHGDLCVALHQKGYAPSGNKGEDLFIRRK